MEPFVIFLGIGSFIIFFEFFLVAFEKPSVGSRAMLLTLLCCGVTVFTYSMQIDSPTPFGFMVALKIGYLFKLYVNLCFLYFVFAYCRRKSPTWLKYVFVPLNTVIQISILYCEKNNLFYKSYTFARTNNVSNVQIKLGPLYYAMIGEMIILSIILIHTLLKTFNSAPKSDHPKYILITIGSIVPLIAMLLNIIISSYIDLVPFSLIFSCIILFILMKKFGIIEEIDVARNATLESTREGLIIVDNNLNLKYVNNTALELVPDIYEKASNDPEFIPDLFTQQEKLYNLQDKNIEIRVSKLQDGSNTIGYMAWMFDMTFLNEYTNQIIELKEAAENANRAKSNFIANISHEIRTPINAVLGLDEMILRDSKERNIKEYAWNIKESGNTLLGLINDILDFSKMESGKLEIYPVEYSVCDMLTDLYNMSSIKAKEKDLTFSFNISSEIPTRLFGDNVRIKQCLINIITNGIKYTERGGVTLSVSHEKVDDEYIDLYFSVKDTGIGIKPEDMQKLFTPFERIEERRNLLIEGTGLGMSIVKDLLDGMNSKLSVESEYGTGSTFSFILRQKIIDPTPIGDYSPSMYHDNVMMDYHESFHAPKARILVVDDTKMNLIVIKGLLRDTQIQVDTCDNGFDAIDMAGLVPYDIIFIDYRMPSIDGIETLSRLKSEPDRASINAKHIMLTANAITGVREQFLSVGFDDYMSKPVKATELEALILKYLPLEKIESVSDEDKTFEEVHEYDSDIEKSELQIALDQIDGIDYFAGIDIMETDDLYKEALTEFAISIENKADLIQDYAEKKDIENMTILVHALKSSSRFIGINKLSKMAEVMEEKGNEKDTEYISENIDELLKLYRSYKNSLFSALGLNKNDSDKSEIDESMLLDAYNTMQEAVTAYDYDTADNIMDMLSKYKIPEKYTDAHSKLIIALHDVDGELITNIINSIPK
ncbi:MAG: response regulator [Butyrivibrio sp.]|nr:response regulator [Butyrivibrio sp.]